MQVMCTVKLILKSIPCSNICGYDNVMVDQHSATFGEPEFTV